MLREVIRSRTLYPQCGRSPGRDIAEDLKPKRESFGSDVFGNRLLSVVRA